MNPVLQVDATCCCMFGPGNKATARCIGGQDGNYQVLNDVLWILDVESGRWKEVSLRIDMVHKFSITNHTCTYTWGSGTVPCVIRYSCGLLYF